MQGDVITAYYLTSGRFHHLSFASCGHLLDLPQLACRYPQHGADEFVFVFGMFHIYICR